MIKWVFCEVVLLMEAYLRPVYLCPLSWRSCKQKRALSKARAAELSASPEGEKLQSDSGVFVDSHSLHDNQMSKGGFNTSSLKPNLHPILGEASEGDVLETFRALCNYVFIFGEKTQSSPPT